MHFASLNEFFAMGGYAFYVWLSFGCTFVLLLGLTIVSVRTRRTIINDIRAKQQRDEKLKQLRTGKKES